MRAVSFACTFFAVASIAAKLIAGEPNSGPLGLPPQLRKLLTPEQKQSLDKEAARQTQGVSIVEPVTSGPSPDEEHFDSAVIDPPAVVYLPKVRWQSLPDGVVSAAVSPDQRIWYLMGGDDGPRKMPQTAIRQVVEREFAKPSPQLQGVVHAFFETEGIQGDRRTTVKRVWLMCRSQRNLLLGYDGKQWIERRMKSGFFGDGGFVRRSFMQFDGGLVVFEPAGCHVLTGSNWIFHDFGWKYGFYDFRVWREADGKGLTVWVTGDTGARRWGFRDGAWSEQPWPKERYAGGRAAVPVKLGDMEKLAQLGQLPSNAYEVVAATDDGTIAFAARIGARLDTKFAPQKVFRFDAPEAAETRIHLAEQLVALNSPGYCIASDGSIWASRGDFGIEWFDGITWRDANKIKRGGSGDIGQTIRLTPFSLVPAQNGWVLAFVGHRVSDLHIERGMIDQSVFHPSYLLLNGKRCSGGRWFEKWIPESRNQFLEAFSLPSPHAPWRAFRPTIAQQSSDGMVYIRSTEVSPFGVVVDKSKNIWALSSGSVCVVKENRAIEVSLPGTITGAARRVTQIASLGDGDFVFLRGATGDTFYAKLAPTGEPEFRIGPRVWDRGPEVCRDGQGALWLTVKEPQGPKVVGGRETGTTVRRVTVHGRGQDFPDVGWPELVDDLGCVWLSPPTGNGGSTVTLWVPSGKTTTVTIPRRAAGSPLIAAGKGRVFALTKAGLQELLADNSDQPQTYALGKLCALDVANEEDLGRVQYSSLGYLVSDGYKTKDGLANPVLRLFKIDGSSVGPEDSRAASTAEPRAKLDVPAAGNLRTWRDSSGRFSVKATLVSAEAGIVELRKADGSTIKVPIEKLSDEDRQYMLTRGY